MYSLVATTAFELFSCHEVPAEVRVAGLGLGLCGHSLFLYVVHARQLIDWQFLGNFGRKLHLAGFAPSTQPRLLLLGRERRWSSPAQFLEREDNSMGRSQLGGQRHSEAALLRVFASGLCAAGADVRARLHPGQP